jgi:hypothetical protein
MSVYRPVNRIAEYAKEGAELTSEHPMSTVVVAFGLGVVTGLTLVVLLTDAQPRRESNVAHRLGQQLLEAMSTVLPDSLARGFRG